MTTLRKGDFIELDYTGRISGGGAVFDTTIPEEAARAKLGSRAAFKPVIICLGESHLLPGLDAFLEGKGLGKQSCTVPAASAFGKKEGKLLKLIPAKKFTEAKIDTFIGLEVNVDGQYGVIRSISGGRITVDFNHPLAGRDLDYEVDVKRVVEKPEEKAGALLEMMGMHHHGVALEGADHIVISVHQALPQPVAESLNGLITRLTGMKTVTYHVDPKGHTTAAESERKNVQEIQDVNQGKE
jgi:FKBP-type peptidyl-prolyl cis-trans isomerase 2